MSTSNEFLYWFDVETTADRSINYFVQLAKVTLEESLPDNQRKALEIAVQRFPEAYRLLKEMLAPIGVAEPMRLRTIYQMLFAMIVSSGAIGASLSQTNRVKMMHLAPQIEGGSRGGKNSAPKRAKKRLYEIEQTSDSIAAGFPAFLGKLAGLAGSITLILHMVRDPQNNARVAVPARTVENAGRVIFEFILPHALEFYQSAQGSSDGEKTLARHAPAFY